MTQEEFLLKSVPIISALLVVVILVLMWTINQVQKKPKVIEKNPLLSFDLAMDILRTKVASTNVELRLTYHEEVVLLSSKTDEVIKEYSKNLIMDLSPAHREALEYYLGKNFMVLFIQRNIRETVVDMVIEG